MERVLTNYQVTLIRMFLQQLKNYKKEEIAECNIDAIKFNELREIEQIDELIGLLK